MAIGMDSTNLITVSTTVMGFKDITEFAGYFNNSGKVAAVPRRITLDIQSGELRVKTKGGDPTTANGRILYVGTYEIVGDSDIAMFRMVRNGTTNCVLHATIED